MTKPQEISVLNGTPVENGKCAPDVESGIRKKNGLSIASVVCGIICGWLPIVCIPAVIFGHMALSKIKKSPDTYAGKVMAIAGLLLGYLGLGLIVSFAIMRAMVKMKLNNLVGH